MNSVNIKKLALELNLSTATVSRALRDSYQISRETKDKVMALAKQLNYQPNHFASNLRNQKSKTIAVIIPEIASNFFSQVINGIEEIAIKKGYHVLIYLTHNNSEIELNFGKQLLSGRVDGVLISVSNETANREHFNDLTKKIPIVFFDRVYQGIDAVTVVTDNYESVYHAVQHLITNGCKKIAYLLALNNLATGKKRLEGYMEALKDNHIAYDESLVINMGTDDQENISLVRDLLSAEKPDGIVSPVEDAAIACYYACKELNLTIPHDLKIVSFSNLKTAPLLNPSLTTITQPAIEMGREAASILFKILEKKEVDPKEVIVIKSTLIERESTSN